MLAESDLSQDQNNAIDRLFDHDHTLLVANMGGGKTVCALTAIKELLAEGVVKRVLVIAPVKVCQTVWAHEAQKWAHLQGLTVADASGGTPKTRAAAIESGAPIVCINFENISWLFRKYKAKGLFDGLVVDELTKLKSSGGAQFKALRPQLARFVWRAGMTGTPVSENWEGLFGQMLVVDGGAALGTRKDAYLRKYFYPTDYNEYNWELYDWAPLAIAKAISGCVYTMPDYRADLPPLNDRIIKLTPPPEVVAVQEQLKNTMAAAFESGEVVADTAAVLSGKLVQSASGFLYGPPDDTGKKGDPIWISDYKQKAFKRLLRDCAARGENVVVAYWFEADRDWLVGEYPDAMLSSEKIAQWNRGELPVLLMHPLSGGHGLNLAKGGHTLIILGGLWSRDVREQLIARLWRRGQLHAVDVWTLAGVGTADELMIARVEDKEEYEKMFKRYVGV